MSKEFSELIKDVKEQVKYLEELGVENLNANLPEISISQKSEIRVTKSQNEISQDRLEKFVPTKDILKDVISKNKGAEEKIESERPKRRSRLLDSARLSRLPSLPKRNLSNRNLQQKQDKINEQRGEKDKMAEPKLNDTLFGDISETLPESSETIEEIRAEIGDCTRCPLHEGRTNIVHSTGNRQSDLMFVGEAPGADEDAKGEPFVGRAGKLLNKIIEAIGMKREDVFIGNINRCRPPGNRQPTPEESETCKPYLLREISIVKPKVIVVLGNTAMKNLLDTKVGITKMRGKFVDYYGVKVMPTFHPAYLLRDPRKKREVWEDMKMVRDEIEKSAE